MQAASLDGGAKRRQPSPPTAREGYSRLLIRAVRCALLVRRSLVALLPRRRVAPRGRCCALGGHLSPGVGSRVEFRGDGGRHYYLGTKAAVKERARHPSDGSQWQGECVGVGRPCSSLNLLEAQLLLLLGLLALLSQRRLSPCPPLRLLRRLGLRTLPRLGLLVRTRLYHKQRTGQ